MHQDHSKIFRARATTAITRRLSAFAEIKSTPPTPHDVRDLQPCLIESVLVGKSLDTKGCIFKPLFTRDLRPITASYREFWPLCGLDLAMFAWI
jgi:hypothetical protein